jgi:hypothetical protein
MYGRQDLAKSKTVNWEMFAALKVGELINFLTLPEIPNKAIHKERC